MYSTANMALTSWDLEQDNFNHTQLDGNWRALDQHDHSVGRGVQIGTPGLQTGAVTTTVLADGAVTNPKLGAAAVGTSNIQNAAITAALIANNAVTGAAIADGTVKFADLDPNIIPLGTVMLWYRGPGQVTTPGGGWEIMDGRNWASITNSLGLITGTIPDMRGVFAQGADLTGSRGPTIGAGGGSNTANLSHSHNVSAHAHGVPAHAHGIGEDGSHIHTWQGGLHMATRTNCLPAGGTWQGAFGGTAGNTFYSMYIKNLLSNPSWYQVLSNGTTEQVIDGQADMDNGGQHAHGGATGSAGPWGTDLATASTDSQLGSVNITPAYVGLLFIMRCR